MACGTVPLVVDRTSLPEVVGEQGIRIKENEAADILRKVETTSNESLVERAESFLWAKTAEKTLEVIN
jgi:glycosyltransferase involved in cell wall biosynthesis